MSKKINVFLALVFLMLFAVSCTTSTSVGGASLETGYEINSDYEIVNVNTTFNAGEDFYFSFFNNEDFGSNVVTIQLIDSESDTLLYEFDYQVEEDWNILADQVFFNDPGKYKIAIIINGKTRATQEVIIQ